MNNLNIDHLRIEIAYLQEEILSSDPPKRAKFKIPVIMTEDRVTSLKTSNKNILNRSNGNISGSPINLDNTIELEVPLEYTFFYGAEKIPKDTRFLVTFVGGNVNSNMLAALISCVNVPLLALYFAKSEVATVRPSTVILYTLNLPP